MDFDLSELSVDNLGSWPTPIKIVACVILSIAIMAAAFWFDTRNQLDELARKNKQEKELRSEFTTKQIRAANFETYRDQLEEMRKSFGHMLHQLPSKTEVPALLEDISKSGVASGLEFKLFDPLQNVKHEFYAELPIKISVIGQYKQFGDFVSRVAALHRIVTLHDFKIKFEHAGGKSSKRASKKEKSKSEDLLQMEIMAKTYNYLD